LKSLRLVLVVLLLSLFLTGCSAFRWTPDYHTVKSGETLYSISMKYNLDQRDLAAWNKLGSGTYIREGQRLRLTPSSGSTYSRKQSPSTTKPSTTAKVLPAPKWLWPTQGKLISRYGESAKTESGIRIAGKAGQKITATAAGEVVYAGTDLRSYGQLLIIKHNESWLSAYGFNSKLVVGEGQKVQAGQKIAEMGSVNGSQTLLHFEIRLNGKPVDPLKYLPKQ
jgi:lipoprotein NlpD